MILRIRNTGGIWRSVVGGFTAEQVQALTDVINPAMAAASDAVKAALESEPDEWLRINACEAVALEFDTYTVPEPPAPLVAGGQGRAASELPGVALAEAAARGVKALLSK